MSGCWLWTGGRSREGYGKFWFGGKTDLAHRYSYINFIGPIPEGLQIDHLCRVRSCCNPQHLEAVTMKENILRGESPQARHARRQYCKNGHPLVEGNLHPDSRGWGRGSCLTCRRLAHKEKHGHFPDPSRWNKGKIRCKQGHEFTEENTYWRADGTGRSCRKCQSTSTMKSSNLTLDRKRDKQAYMKEYRAKNRERLREQKRAWDDKNRDHVTAYSREYERKKKEQSQ